MISLRFIFLGLISLYIFGVAMVFFDGTPFSSQSQIRELNSIQEEEEQTFSDPYRFINPELAYEVLTQFERIEVPDQQVDYRPPNKNAIPYLNLKNDDEYCDKRRSFFVQFPETVFDELNFISDLDLSLVRSKVLRPLGNDVQPYIGGRKSKTDQLFDIKLSVSSFYSRMALFIGKKVGTHFSCLSQFSNHLPGKQVLDKKDNLAEAVIEYAARYTNRPQCFNDNKFFPKTFLLYREADCKRFFEHLKTPQYQALKDEKKIAYMKKIGRGLHMGAGVDPLTDTEEVALKKMYDNGKKCGKVDDKILIQNFIHNPLLLHGRKFDFRMYMFVASSNPTIAYYHDGYLRVSLVPYDVDSNDKKSLLTNLALSNDLYKDAKDGKLWEGMTFEEMKIAQQWSFERLQRYLLETGVISDPNWLDNYLRPEFKKAMTHLLRFGLITPYEDSTVSQFFGIDFMLDEDLNLWFIEANSAPGIGEYWHEMEKFIVKMLQDQVEILTGLLRSRMKRAISYVNELIQNGSVTENEQGEVKVKHFEVNRAKFQKLMENSFEREFEPSPSNGFSKIIDGNYKGAAKYMGNIPAECL